MQIPTGRHDMSNPRAAFTPTDVADEALIEALADLEVAERALAQRGGGAVLCGMLAEARHSLECVRFCLHVDVTRVPGVGAREEQRGRV